MFYGLEVGLDILTLAAHYTYELQPLDVAIFQPLKLNMAQEKVEMMRKDLNYAKGSILMINLAKMVSRAFTKALKPKSIKVGFATTDLYPLNKKTMKSK